MGIVPVIQSAVKEQLKALYQFDSAATDITVNETKPEFEGDYTVVLFSFVKSRWSGFMSVKPRRI